MSRKVSTKKNVARLTPLMRQYNQVKAKYPDAILLFRVGDFYETFGEDAVTTAKVLGIILTKRNNGGSDVELAGFPHHSMDLYLPRLVRAGYRVAICDQLEKPSKEKKIVKRGVTEVVTPGVAVDERLLDHRTNNYLAAVSFGRTDEIGLAFMDISTGEFLISEGDVAYIDKLLQSFQPSEILVAKHKQRLFEKHFGERFYTYPLDQWVFSQDYAREKLLDHFGVQNLKGFGVEELKTAQIAAGASLHYLSTTENNNLIHISTIGRIHADRYVWLDRFTIRNLELLYSPHESGIPLIEILDCTTSPMGARLLKKWVALPLKSRKAVESRHDIVDFFLKNKELAQQLKENIGQIGDLERLISKVPLGKINPAEVVQLGCALDAILPIKEGLSQVENDHIKNLVGGLNPCLLLREQIASQLVPEPPKKLDKGGVIADGVSATLDELRDIVRSSQNILTQIQKTEAGRTGIDNLKIGFNNVFGYYLEVTNKYKNKGLVPATWIRKQTLTNAERYITEELKVLESKILGAEEEILELEDELFRKLIHSILDYILPVQHNANIIARLDCLLSFAQVAQKHHYCRPQLNDELAIDIRQGRHPVIEQHLDLGESYVPNDVYLDPEQQQILMITGPNMAGKSALLRQTALICLMAQMGSFVPAQSASLGMVDKVFTRVGASDNISSGESTFMVEMNETASIMNNISERSLILLDEIGRGTSTYDGISIAWSIAEYLHNNGQHRPKTLFATHYHELNELANKYHRIKNFNIATKEIGQRVIFLRKLVPGGSSHSFGIYVAKLAGMPRSIVERAAHILTQLEQKVIEKDLSESTPKLAPKLQQLPPDQLHLKIFEGSDALSQKLKEMLLSLDLNTMTPIDCMLKLRELIQLIADQEEQP